MGQNAFVPLCDCYAVFWFWPPGPTFSFLFECLQKRIIKHGCVHIFFSLFAGGQQTEWDALISTHAGVSASALTDSVAKDVAVKIKWKVSKWKKKSKKRELWLEKSFFCSFHNFCKK